MARVRTGIADFHRDALGIGRLLRAYLCAIVITLLLLGCKALAQSAEPDAVPLLDRISTEVLFEVFPGATRLKLLDDGGPTAAETYRGQNLVGYVFSTLDVLRAPGYSSTPFDVVAGVDLEGRITGAVVLFHREPYLINDARRTAQLVTFLRAMRGTEARMGVESELPPGFVAGATISARAMRNAVQEGARMVLRYRTEDFTVAEPTIDMINFKPMDADQLVENGGYVNAKVTNADLLTAMSRAGLGDLLPEVPMTGGQDHIYIDFVAGYANPPKIGRNGTGLEPYDTLVNILPEGTHGIFVATLGGVYDHRGTRYNNLSSGFLLDRVSVTQGREEYRFDKPDMIVTWGKVADILVLPPDNDFDAMAPFQVNLFASALRPDRTREPFLLASLDYQLPEAFILMPEPPPPPVWIEAWQADRFEIAVLSVALALLTAILAFQTALTKRRRVFRHLRNGFLVFTLVWVGWIAGAQLSIVHLVNYLKAPFVDLSLAFYLAEPLIVIISVYTALSLIVLGRGVFCGWLCPFGALQELLAIAARTMKLPQWNPPERLQRRLWSVKYVSLGTILVLIVTAPDLAIIAEEVEPFKTAITAMFARALPYVIYAVGLLIIGLFTERAFCRFLCPLGASLAILDRLHILELLKRRPECGNPCHLCERSCPVRAIESTGKIVMAECFQCLDCMVEYHDDQRCPPLAKLRKERERAAGTRPRPAIPDPAIGVSA